MKSVMKKGALGPLGVSLLSLAIAMPAAAQATSDSKSGKASKADDTTVIVVTGTLLRGKAPVGTNLISVGQDKIESSGATNSNDLLASVPQVSNYFNSVPVTQLGVPTAAQVDRPNLRNLPGGGYATGASTLILVDGHRVANEGVTQLSVDPDLIPTGAIDHVEMVTDGGSATYGADAIGGVINFITKRKFNGFKIDTQYGAADHYTTYDTVATLGKAWSGGSAYLSYSFNHSSALYAHNTDYVKRVDYTQTPVVGTSTQCALSNITMPGLYLPQYNFTLPGATYAYPGLIANTTNHCDTDAYTTYVPEVKRQSLFAGYSQDINDRVKLDVRAFWSERDVSSNLGPLVDTVGVPSTNPYYIPIASNPTATQQVSFSFGPVLGNDNFGKTTFKESGVNATFTVDLNANWQLRSLFNYSDSDSKYFLQTDNTSLLAQYAAGTTTATAIDPYNLSATTNKSLIADIGNYAYQGDGKDTLWDLRDIVDGKLWSLPGGDVHLAIGYEYNHDEFTQRYLTGVYGALAGATPDTYDRGVNSLFAEMQVPLVGSTNAIPGVQSLVLDLSGRYDVYSDFGHTSNPKIGLNYKPISWIGLYGNWGTSFNAPTLVDQLGSTSNTILSLPFAVAVKPGTSAPAGSWMIAVLGSAQNLKPQTADTWSTGINLDPPFIPGLHANLSYYNIFFKGELGKPPVADVTTLFNDFASSVTINPTDAQIQALGALASNTGGPAQVAPFLNGARSVYELIDFRTRNFGNSRLSGVDFSLSYRHPAFFGSWDGSIAGNYQLTHKTQVTASAPFTNDLAYGVSRLSLQTNLGANIGDLRAQLTLNHSAGYDVQRSPTLPQDNVKSYDVVNAFFKYPLAGNGLYQDLDLTLNINNLFDRNPPFYAGVGSDGYANGSTIGREFLFGLSKKF